MSRPDFDPLLDAQVVEELGRGAYAAVYRIQRDGVHYAVKATHSAAGADERTMVAFRREAALLARIDHPAVPRVFDVGRSAGRPYLIMEFVDGRSLAALLDTARCTEAQIIRLGTELAGALGAVHRAGLVHRDVKPANVLLDPGGNAHLIDFGLAAAGRAHAGDEAAGTFDYSAPEQTGMLARPVDGRADLYSLGVVLYQCATGELPFRSADTGELIRMHATVPAPDPRTRNPGLSPGLAALIGRLLAKDPDDRFGSATEVADRLRRLAAPAPAAPAPHEPVTHHPAKSAATPAHHPAESAEPPAHPAESAEPPAHHPAEQGEALVCRGAELAELGARWARAAGGAGGFALLTGPAGSGKSALAGAVAARVGAAGGLVLTGRCSADESAPAAALRGAVDRYATRLSASPEAARHTAVDRVRQAAGTGGHLLAPLSGALAGLLDLPVPEAETRPDLFTTAVAAFLAGLARAHGGLLIHLDDVQWLDPLSRQVLRRLSEELAGTPLLLVATARDADPDFTAACGSGLDLTVPLGPLTDDDVARLVTGYLTGAAAGPELVREIAVRGRGNPFMILEYLRALVDAGALRPCWGTWVLDTGVLRGVDLPSDVMDVVLARLDRLGGAARDLLTAAAAIGTSFTPALLTAVTAPDPAGDRAPGTADTGGTDGGGTDDSGTDDSGTDDSGTDDSGTDGSGRLTGGGADVGGRLAGAVEDGLLQRAAGHYAFVHDRIREALLSALPEPARRDLHQRIAAALDRTHPAGPADVYAVASHYARGDTARTPERVFATGAAAGLLALAEYAPATAVGFLEPAVAAAQVAGIVPDGRFQEALGRAYLAGNQVDEAMTALTAGLARERDRTRRAALSLRLALAYRVKWDLRRSSDVAWRGLAEAGCLLPRRPFAVTLWTLGQLLRWIVGGRRPAARPAGGERREQLRLAIWLCSLLGTNMYMWHKPLWTVPFALHSARLGAELGRSAEYATSQMGLSSLAAMLRLRRRRERHHRLAVEVAAEVGDPATSSYVAYTAAVVESVICGGPLADLVRVAEEHRRWLDPDYYLNVVAMHCRSLAARGHAREAAALHAHGLAALAGAPVPEAYAIAGVLHEAMLGRPADPGELLARECGEETGPGLRLMLVQAATACAVERGDLGPPFEAAVAALGGTGASPVIGRPEIALALVYQAWGRLALVREAGGTDRPGHLTGGADQAGRPAVAAAVVRRLGRAANSDFLKACHKIARADLAVSSGAHGRALRLLARGEALVFAADAPVLEHEAARVRARALLGLGRAGAATRQAQAALALAEEHGWVHRARRVRAEFGLTEAASRATTGRTRQTSVTTADRNRSRLEALQQVSLAAATIVDPREVARVALDETLRILGAERAVLFLVDPGADSDSGADGGGRLRPSVGRGAGGEDLTELSGYSSTLVDRVAETRQAIVVTGSDEGAALGSRSALVYGLRSIVVAPLELDRRLLGVVYLDSRVAKGVFTERDIDVLTAVNSYIAVSLETARAAQLEVAVRTAQQQRDVAETLRDAMARLGGTLDPDEVRRQLLAVVTALSPADRACLLYEEDSLLTVTGADGMPGPVPAGVNARGLVAMDGAVRDEPAFARDAGALLGPAGSWVAVPVGTHSCGRGVLVAAAPDAGAFGEEHLHLVAAIAGQGATAYENARLYTRVQHLATTDALTGVSNRRHFADHAVRLVAIARRNHRPLAALMVDIDHFKRINDGHGHAAGDEVIRRVAACLRDNVRDPDIVCRYGGEEFAIVMTEMHGDPVEIAERLRRTIAETPVPVPAGPLRLTVSIGVAELKPDDDLETLLGRADAALYRAKEGGRDQVRPG